VLFGRFAIVRFCFAPACAFLTLRRAAAIAPRRTLGDRIGERFTTGAVAGMAAGLVFLLANMGYATTQDLPALAPTYDISTIFHGQDIPEPGPENAVVGLVTHATLSLAFGIVFALLAVPFLARLPLLVVGGVVYGLLHLANFQILGRAFIPWFTDPMGPDQGFELFIHGVFGLLLTPFFVRSTPSEEV
jgi:hypothetical protein